MMRMEHRLTQTQRQQLVLTQKMQQALKILQLSGMELEQEIQQELESNPFLEQVRKKEEVPDAPAEPASKDDDPVFDESFDLDAYADRWREGRGFSRNKDLEARRQYYEDSITQQESLRAHLLTQLRLACEDDAAYAIGERIVIGDIDNKGYFTGDVAAIARELNVPEDLVEEALDTIKRFEPTGVGAKDAVECLLLQIAVEYPHEDELKVLVRDHLEALTRRQVPQIAKAMAIKPERVEELKNMLATLNPWPGHEYASAPTQYVTPEVVVEKVDGEYIVRLMNERVPELRINDSFHRIVRNGRMSAEEKSYVQSKIEAARWLKRNIAQRQQTILKVGQAIVDVQEEFLEKGVEFIKPLTLQDIADKVGVHESTVARTTRGKYMQTPQGLFELKYFFSPGLKNDDGGEQSSKSVQAMIKKIVDEENKSKPLSDQKIANLLKEEGINVARRTVSKYREGMGILAASMRKEY